MLHSSERSTRSGSQRGVPHDEELWESESSLSHHSDEVEHQSSKQKHPYTSTNLLSASWLTLADVIAEEVTSVMIHDRQQMAAARARFKASPYGIVDPRATFKSYHGGDIPDTLLTKEEVLALSQKAHVVVLAFLNDRGA
jgi:hypothetical protein